MLIRVMVTFLHRSSLLTFIAATWSVIPEYHPVLIYFAEDGHVYHCTNAHGTQVSAVGAGDSSIAGFIKGLAEGKSIEERLQYSMAAGGATAFSEHLGSYELWESLLPQIKVTLIK